MHHVAWFEALMVYRFEISKTAREDQVTQTICSPQKEGGLLLVTKVKLFQEKNLFIDMNVSALSAVSPWG